MSESFDVVVVSGTPGGIMAAIAAARAGYRSVILERTSHIGGLPANGLGATDIATRGCASGLFREFVRNIHAHYVQKYGADSEQVKVASEGYHFEAHVAAKVLDDMIAAEGSKITVKLRRQFDAELENVTLDNGALKSIKILDRDSGKIEEYTGKVFIDATYEGDLAAAAGAPYRVGREGRSEFNEEMAGIIYRAWPHAAPGAGSSRLGDNAVQAYNYRVCLTDDPAIRVPIEKPAGYNREEYSSLVDDIKSKRYAGQDHGEYELDGIGFVTNMVPLPNRKTDANNQHLAFVSTDLPEENWLWPTVGWAWRDKFAIRLRNYILGLFYFAQNDPELPADFKERAKKWGLSKTEYQDNGYFPRQVYVREGRRIEGEYFFSAHDSIPVAEGKRPPIHKDSIAASHYAIDSHACRKREPNRDHLEGFLSYPTKPYTVPYGVILPKKVENLLTPVPISATHAGFGTLRMEPCWMALGQAAGTAAALAISSNKTVRTIDITELQKRLLAQQAVLIYFKDSNPGDTGNADLQLKALQGKADNVGWNQAEVK